MLAEVTFSTQSYVKARKYNIKMAYKKGKVDKVFEYCEKDLPEEFVNKNKKIFTNSKGGGYWLWKPYVVNRTLEQLKEGDYLFYCDSGAFLIGDLHILVDYMKEYNLDCMCFELDLLEKYWTKRDIFIELRCDRAEYAETNQRCATYFLIRKTEKTVRFVQEWLKYAQIYELISDEDNAIYGQENYDGFCENRHDQSIFSILSKRYGFPGYKDISQFRYPIGWKSRAAARKRITKLEYPILVCLHRQKKADFTSRWREYILCNFPELKRYLHYGYH